MSDAATCTSCIVSKLTVTERAWQASDAESGELQAVEPITQVEASSSGTVLHMWIAHVPEDWPLTRDTCNGHNRVSVGLGYRWKGKDDAHVRIVIVIVPAICSYVTTASGLAAARKGYVAEWPDAFFSTLFFDVFVWFSSYAFWATTTGLPVALKCFQLMLTPRQYYVLS